MNDEIIFQKQRYDLVQTLINKGIKDRFVLKAIGNVPRHEFMMPIFRARAYEDSAMRIDEEQTISQPYTVAYQSQLLKVEKGDRILEIGTGSGYQACVLAEMGAKVFSIERIRKLYSKSKKLIQKLCYFKVETKYGDGFEGWPEKAAFDKIIVTAAAPNIPKELVKQLKVGGFLIIPCDRPGQNQEMLKVNKLSESEYTVEELGSFSFVPMLEGVESGSRYEHYSKRKR
ncbi:UNVERIFIED_CONTAM: hypothetical protein GTU68_022646 [Idotea baltica]|nr:hypothetical protein [Idotea baltica]